MSRLNSVSMFAGMENSESEVRYLTEEFIRTGILEKDGSKKISTEKHGIDYIIYPGEQYIPKCPVCEEVYRNCALEFPSDMIVESPHCKCPCLWWNYFKLKIKKLKPFCSFVVKKIKKEKN